MNAGVLEPKIAPTTGSVDAEEYATSSSGTVRDQIEYLADMILELRQISARSGLTTLSGILELAHAEAQLQSRRAG